MGVGRREFLKLLTAAVAGLAFDQRQSVITNKNTYVNQKFGILFDKPEGWGFINVKDFGKLKENQILSETYEPIKDEVWEELGDPICIATKYYEDLPEFKGVFSPTITLNVSHKSEFADMRVTFKQLIRLSQMGVSQVLKKFKIVKRYPVSELCGCECYEYDATYLFEHVELPRPVKVELKTLKIEHNDYYYDFNFHQSLEENEMAATEFEKFIRSVKLI